MGDNVVGVAMVTAIMALAAHLDGGGSSTFCIVIPAMFPVYMRMHMRKTTLLRIAILPMGIMNDNTSSHRNTAHGHYESAALDRFDRAHGHCAGH